MILSLSLSLSLSVSVSVSACVCVQNKWHDCTHLRTERIRTRLCTGASCCAAWCSGQCEVWGCWGLSARGTRLVARRKTSERAPRSECQLPRCPEGTWASRPWPGTSGLRRDPARWTAPQKCSQTFWTWCSSEGYQGPRGCLWSFPRRKRHLAWNPCPHQRRQTRRAGGGCLGGVLQGWPSHQGTPPLPLPQPAGWRSASLQNHSCLSSEFWAYPSQELLPWIPGRTNEQMRL